MGIWLKSEFISNGSRYCISQKCVTQQYEIQILSKHSSWAAQCLNHFPSTVQIECQNKFKEPMSCLFMEIHSTLLINFVKRSANSHNSIVVTYTSWSFFFIRISLLHMMCSQIHRQNYAYTYIHTFFTLYIEFHACMHIKLCQIYTHHTHDWADLC
jgi:hypothetical protein